MSLSSNMIRRTKKKGHFGAMLKTLLWKERVFSFYSNFYFFLFFFLFEAIFAYRDKKKYHLLSYWSFIALFEVFAHTRHERVFFFFE